MVLATAIGIVHCLRRGVSCTTSLSLISDAFQNLSLLYRCHSQVSIETAEWLGKLTTSFYHVIFFVLGTTAALIKVAEDKTALLFCFLYLLFAMCLAFS